MPARRVATLRRLAAFGAVSCLYLCAATVGAHAEPNLASAGAQVAGKVDSFMASELSEYAGSQLGPFTNESWTDSESTYWELNDGGAATAAATLHVLGGEWDATYLQEAEQTINAAITDQQTSGGGFIGRY